MDVQNLADTSIHDHVLYAMGGAAVPVPLLDLAAVTAVQLDLVRDLAAIYGVPYDLRAGRAVISSIVGASLPRIGASVVKAIPGAGMLLGAFTQVALSGATTWAVGKVFQHQFEAGATLVTLRVERVRGLYLEYLDQGRDVASRLRDGRRSGARISREDLDAVLARLEEMRDTGEITDIELARLKASARAHA